MNDKKANPVQASALDLDDAIQNETGTLVVKHPVTGLATTTRITLAGITHPMRVAHRHAKQREVQRAMQLEGSYTLPDPTDAEADEIDYLARCTLGWSGLVVGGQVIEHSVEAARKILGDPRRHWLRNQVKQGLDQQELFIGGSAIA